MNERSRLRILYGNLAEEIYTFKPSRFHFSILRLIKNLFCKIITGWRSKLTKLSTYQYQLNRCRLLNVFMAAKVMLVTELMWPFVSDLTVLITNIPCILW